MDYKFKLEKVKQLPIIRARKLILNLERLQLNFLIEELHIKIMT